MKEKYNETDRLVVVELLRTQKSLLEDIDSIENVRSLIDAFGIGNASEVHECLCQIEELLSDELIETYRDFV